MALDIEAAFTPVTNALTVLIEQLRHAGELNVAAKVADVRTRVRKLVRQELEARRVVAESKPVAPTRASVVLAVEAPIHTFSEANQHQHWSQRYRQSGDQRPVVAMVMHAHANAGGIRVQPPCTVQLTRLAPTSLDSGDNEAMALKHVRDGVADWLRVDDRDSRVTWVYGQEHAKHYGVRIEVLL